MKIYELCCNSCKKVLLHELNFINQTPKDQAGARIVYLSVKCIACDKTTSTHMSSEIWDKIQ